MRFYVRVVGPHASVPAVPSTPDPHEPLPTQHRRGWHVTLRRGQVRCGRAAGFVKASSTGNTATVCSRVVVHHYWASLGARRSCWLVDWLVGLAFLPTAGSGSLWGRFGCSACGAAHGAKSPPPIRYCMRVPVCADRQRAPVALFRSLLPLPTWNSGRGAFLLLFARRRQKSGTNQTRYSPIRYLCIRFSP